MKNLETKKNKVIARLTKWGHNEDTATAWVNEHFEYANRYYNTIGQIAECIQCI